MNVILKEARPWDEGGNGSTRSAKGSAATPLNRVGLGPAAGHDDGAARAVAPLFQAFPPRRPRLFFIPRLRGPASLTRRPMPLARATPSQAPRHPAQSERGVTALAGRKPAR